MRVGGKLVTLGYFATAEQAALFYARREAGRDTRSHRAAAAAAATRAFLCRWRRGSPAGGEVGRRWRWRRLPQLRACLRPQLLLSRPSSVGVAYG